MADPLDGPTVPEPGSYDAPPTTEDAQRAAEASLREDRLRRVEAAIMAGPDGREWLWAILVSYSTFKTRVSMTGTDYEIGYMAGERDAGLRLFERFVRVDPAAFALMFAEQDK